jgi:biopolymer transport protein ExbB/TolQ
MPMHRPVIGLAALIAVAGAPGLALAQAAPLTPATVIADAAAPMKVVMLVLLVALIAAVVLTVRKLRSGALLTGGSAYVSALRLGAPLLGLLGAAYNGLMILLALANRGPQPIDVVAPGLAEAAFLLVLGLAVGVVAVVCHWAIESRIDRMVLKG